MGKEMQISSGLTLLIPQMEDQRKILEVVDERTRLYMMKNFKFNCRYEWMATTVASVVFDNILKTLNKKMVTANQLNLPVEDTILNISNMLLCFPSVRTNEEAEKVGNIFPRFKLLTTDLPEASMTEEQNVFITSDSTSENDKKWLEVIEKSSRKEVFIQNGITISNSWATYTLFLVYFKHLVEYVKERTNGDEPIFNVNFFDAIVIIGRYNFDTENVEIYLNSSVDSKLLAKDDNITEFDEFEDGDDDDF